MSMRHGCATRSRVCASGGRRSSRRRRESKSLRWGIEEAHASLRRCWGDLHFVMAEVDGVESCATFTEAHHETISLYRLAACRRHHFGVAALSIAADYD